MVHKEISFTNVFDEPKTFDAYFNLTKSEMFKVLAPYGDKLDEKIDQFVKENDYKGMLDLYEAIVKAAYGKRVGDMFVKDKETLNEFLYSGRYDALLEQLLIDEPDSLPEFLFSILPNDVGNKARESFAQNRIPDK